MTIRPELKPVVELNGAKKSFGAVRALDDVTFSTYQGQCIGLVGHNGAGKSTLVNILNGSLAADEGSVFIDGSEENAFSISASRAAGLRCVFQELSLCPNLTVLENVRITHSDLQGWGWRGKAEALISNNLDLIFPGHGINSREIVGNLSISQRQMVEIAMAFSDTGRPPSLVILDEPTSSLDASVAAQLLSFVRRFVETGGSVIFISHILNEVLDIADRIVVMQDGRVVADDDAKGFTSKSLVAAMGSVVAEKSSARNSSDRSGVQPVLEVAAMDIRAYAGEVIGLAGLAGHGQTRELVSMYRARTGDWWNRREIRATFVAGDRIVDGVFPLWSILQNFSVNLLTDLARLGFIAVDKERDAANDWRNKISIRTDRLDNPILSLSGGNQQKVLFARALSTRAPIVLMDDPMRGVDIGTKQEVYAMIRAEAEKGRTFIWYSTEVDEICQCDRVYVFREGQVSAELTGASITESEILQASFKDHVS